MRPITLYLRNFKSYGEDAPMLNFDAFDVVLLTGENGNGKSSLADAMTWCIWGQCKGMDRRGGMDDLVRTGAEEMEVAFAFEEEGEFYKILRKRDKKRGQSALDFMVRRGEQYVSISGDRIDETQMKIQEVIKLDYETYLCTGYLSQGKADLFAVKKPNERKEILAEILNLEVYEKLQRRAMDKRNQLNNDLELVERELIRMEQEVLEKTALQEEMEGVLRDLEELQREANTTKGELSRLQSQREEKQAVQNKIGDYQRDVEREKKQILDLERDREELEERIQGYQKALEREEEIGTNYQELKKLEQEEKTLREKLDALSQLERRQERLKGEMKRREQETVHQVSLLEQEMSQLEGKAQGQEAFSQELKEIEGRLEELQALEKQQSALEQQLEACTHETAQLNAQKNALEQQLEELRKRYLTLKDVELDCPICQRPLNAHQKEQLVEEFTQKGQSIRKEIQEREEKLQANQKKAQEVHKETQSIRQQLKERGPLEGRSALLGRQMDEALRAEARIRELKEKIAPLKVLLTSGDYAGELRAEEVELERRIKELHYDPRRHREVQAAIRYLDSVTKEWEEVQAARVRLDSEQQSLERVVRLVEDREKHVESLSRLLGDLMESAKGLPEILQKLTEAEERVERLDKSLRALEMRRGALAERLKQIRETEKEIEQRKEAQKEKLQQTEIYKNLAHIYSKKGIQAAIIENAIPELQDETNRILARITDGRLTVEFLTQRDTKGGNVMETLDIKISDGMDTRKYETYSGGEEFRINFAIRIALAKTLAHRAGANLRMLVMDEGFGALDDKGRERLVEVINAIRDEFEKIVVITHIQDLKDAFPAQIEVVKTPAGSTFRMVG